MIAAIILAAGASTRLGKPKQLVEIAGETLLERTVRTARDAGCSPLIVVLGCGYVEILANTRLGDAVPVINADWREGMASSIRLGVKTLALTAKAVQGAVLMTCDQPAVTASHLRALIATGQVTASSYAERRGVPAYFPSQCFAALTQLTGDLGARDLLRDAPAIDLPGGELDIDTAPDLDTAKQLFGKHS